MDIPGVHGPPQAAPGHAGEASESVREGGIDWGTGELIAFGSFSWTGPHPALPVGTAGGAPSSTGTRC